MYLLAKFGVHRSYGNGDSSSYINSYMNEYLEKSSTQRLDAPYWKIFKIRNRISLNGWTKKIQAIISVTLYKQMQKKYQRILLWVWEYLHPSPRKTSLTTYFTTFFKFFHLMLKEFKARQQKKNQNFHFHFAAIANAFFWWLHYKILFKILNVK